MHIYAGRTGTSNKLWGADRTARRQWVLWLGLIVVVLGSSKP
jgi:hypothetical protein